VLVLVGCGGGEAPDAVLVYGKQRFVLGDNGYVERGTLFVADADGSNGRRLADGLYPDVSPDGHWVAYRRSSESPDLYVLDTDGGKPRLVARDPGVYDWAPDSRSLAVAVGRTLTIVDLESGEHFFDELWVMRPDGSRERSLGRSGQIRPFAWSQDGRRLLATYLSVVSSAPVAVDPLTGEERPIDRFGAEAYTTGFSKDGRFVLVWERGDLVRIPWEGGAREVLVRNVDEVADWSL
jgi:Tol biopolymer transport system component